MSLRFRLTVAPLVRTALGLFALAAATVSAAEAPPAGIDGIWDVGLTKPFGLTLRTFLVLREDGNRVVGTVFPSNSGQVPSATATGRARTPCSAATGVDLSGEARRRRPANSRGL